MGVVWKVVLCCRSKSLELNSKFQVSHFPADVWTSSGASAAEYMGGCWTSMCASSRQEFSNVT